MSNPTKSGHGKPANQTRVLTPSETIEIRKATMVRARVCWFCDFAHAPAAPCMMLIEESANMAPDGATSLLAW